MLKLMKYMKPYLIIVLAIIALLFGQAMADLSLPDYMSDIVNNGIQQGGIEYSVPEVIRKSEYEKLVLLMTDSEREYLEGFYASANSQIKDYGRFLKRFPLLNSEPTYILKNRSDQNDERLNSIWGKAIMAVYGIGTTGFEDMADIPETMVRQSAAEYIKNEYKALGADIGKMQSGYILKTGLIMLLVAVLSMISTVLVGLLAARMSAGLGRDVRRSLFSKVVEFSGTEFDQFSTASLITRTTNDVQQIQMLMVMLFRMVFYAPILGIGGVIRVLSTNTNMGWIIAVAVMAILTLVLVLFFVAVPRFKIIQKLVDRLNLVTRESLEGMLVIRAFNTQKHEEQRFDEANTHLTRTHLFVSRIMALMMPIMMLIMNGISVLIVWVGAHQVDAGAMQVGSMMAFIQYTMHIIMAFLMISMVSIMLPRASVSAQRIAEVLSTKTAIRDPESPIHFKTGGPAAVEFKNVFFRYPGAEDYVLHDISFTAEPGKTTALIGSTGSGKSTLVNLIPRFYDVSDGQILIDGTDIRHVTQRELRNRIGYVPQKGILFSGTIESNLRYGDENAPDALLEKAAQVAQASQFISEKPEGMQSPISQGGSNVSGGQKQRLSIARALVKKPDIFIFDDSFSALDFKTDAALRKALRAEAADSTVLIVAQRISTIKDADQIIVLDNGRIAGKGTHQDLMANCQVYREIALSQLTEEELVS